MRGGNARTGPCGDELTARVFRALYPDFDLRSVEVIHIVVSRGTPCFAGSSLGDVARQISDHEQRQARKEQ